MQCVVRNTHFSLMLYASHSEHWMVVGDKTYWNNPRCVNHFTHRRLLAQMSRGWSIIAHDLLVSTFETERRFRFLN